MDRGNRYGASGTRSRNSPTRKKNLDSRETNNFERNNDGRDNHSEYIDRFLGSFHGANPDINVSGSSRSGGPNRDSRSRKREPERAHQKKNPMEDRGFWKNQKSGGQRSQYDNPSSFKSSPSKSNVNIGQNHQIDFGRPTPASSSFSKSVSVWDSNIKQPNQTDSTNIFKLQNTGFIPGTSGIVPSSTPMPVPPPNLSLFPGQGPDRGYGNFQSSNASLLSLRASGGFGSVQLGEPNAPRPFNTTVPPPSVALPSMTSLVPVDIVKGIPDGTTFHIYPPPDLGSLTFDQTTGLRFDSNTGLHYDANSGYFYNYKLSLFLVYDVLKQTYVRAPVHTAGVSGEQLMQTGTKPCGAPIPQMLLTHPQTTTASAMVIQEAPGSSVGNFQNRLAANQWNPPVAPIQDNTLRGGRNMSENANFGRNDGLLSNDADKLQWQNKNTGRSSSGVPRGNTMSQTHDTRSFGQSNIPNNNFSHRANESKSFRSRSRSDENSSDERMEGHQRMQQKIPTQSRFVGNDPDYRNRPYENIPKVSATSEMRTTFGKSGGRNRNPVIERSRPSRRDDHALSPDHEFVQKEIPESYSPLADFHSHSPVYREQDRRESSQQISDLIEKRDYGAYRNDHPGENIISRSKWSKSPSRERTFADPGRRSDYAGHESRDSQSRRRHEDHTIAHSRGLKDRDVEQAVEHRKSPSFGIRRPVNNPARQNQSSSAEKSKHGSTIPTSGREEAWRDCSPANERNDRRAPSGNKERQLSHFNAESTKSRIDRKMEEVKVPRQIEDYSADVSALLQDYSSEMSMDEDIAYDEPQVQSERKSQLKPSSIPKRTQDDVENKNYSLADRDSFSHMRSSKTRNLSDNRRSRSNESLRRKPRVSSPTFNTRCEPRPRHSDLDRSSTSPQPRRGSQQERYDSQRTDGSRRRSRSPIRGRDVRRRSPSLRRSRSRSPLSRLGQVRQAYDRNPSHQSSYRGRQDRQMSPHTKHSLRNRSPIDQSIAQKKSPIRDGSNRHRPPQKTRPDRRQSPYDYRSEKGRTPTRDRPLERREAQDSIRQVKSPSRHKSPTDARSDEYSSCDKRNKLQSSSGVLQEKMSTDSRKMQAPKGQPVKQRTPEILESGVHSENSFSRSRARNVDEFSSRRNPSSSNQDKFMDNDNCGAKRSAPTSPRRSLDRHPTKPDLCERLKETSVEKTSPERHHVSITSQKHEKRRSPSQEIEKFPQLNKPQDIIVLDSEDDIGDGVPCDDEAPMTDDDNDEIIGDETHISPSQSIGNLSMNSDELNYSASSVGSEPFNEEDESWTVLDCVEGESEEEVADSIGEDFRESTKEDDCQPAMKRDSIGKKDGGSGILRRERVRVRGRKRKQVMKNRDAVRKIPEGLCTPIEGDTHSLSPFFEPNPTKFIAATWRNRHVSFTFVKQLLVRECHQSNFINDVKIIPCKRDINAAPYDFVMLIFSTPDIAAEWYSTHNGKIVTKYKGVRLELYLYFHLGNWRCQNCLKSNFPLRSICYSCFKHKDGGFSPVKLTVGPTRFIAIYKLAPMRPKQVVEPFIELFKRNPYKRLHMIKDPRTQNFSGICVIEMPNRMKGQALYRRLPIEYAEESRCAYVQMVEPGDPDSEDNYQPPPQKGKARSFSTMPFKNFKTMSQRPQLPKPDQQLPKPDGRGRVVYPTPDENTFTFEPITKMYFDPVTGLYFHPQSNLFYNDELHICLRWDPDRQSYFYIDTGEID